MKVTRVVEYEGTEEDLILVLRSSVLTASPVCKSGSEWPQRFSFEHAVPKVTIRLVSETWE